MGMCDVMTALHGFHSISPPGAYISLMASSFPISWSCALSQTDLQARKPAHLLVCASYIPGQSLFEVLYLCVFLCPTLGKHHMSYACFSFSLRGLLIRHSPEIFIHELRCTKKKTMSERSERVSGWLVVYFVRIVRGLFFVCNFQYVWNKRYYAVLTTFAGENRKTTTPGIPYPCLTIREYYYGFFNDPQNFMNMGCEKGPWCL